MEAGAEMLQDRDKILFKYVKGIKIAFVNYTYGTNGIPVPSGKEFCVNLIDKDLMKSILMKSPNISAISKKSLYTFDDRDILDW